jgi:hypothetical protein
MHAAANRTLGEWPRLKMMMPWMALPLAW